MGMNKLIPGRFRAIWLEKRRPFFPLMIFATLLFCIVLVGCGGTSLPPENGNEVVAEETTAEETITEEPVPDVEKPDWCNAEQDLYELLPNLGGVSASGISVEICILGGESIFDVETYEGDPEDLESTKALDSPFEIFALLTYFKIKNDEGVVTTFDPPLLMRITYSLEAWNAILEREYTSPKVAFLEEGEEGWVDPWVEFSSEIYLVVEPDFDDPDSYGYLEIIIEEIPDPLIGGC